MLESTTHRIGTLWCKVVHDSPMWPIHGQYRCRTCGRSYPVQWAAEPARVQRTRDTSFRAALLPSVIATVLLLAAPAHAADVLVTDSTAQAAIAFTRYAARLEQANPWSTEILEIDAVLPKLEKHGRLRA